MKFLNSVKDFVLWLFLTKHCRYCNALIAKEEDLCENCKENLPVISGEKCKNCGAGKERCSCKNHRMKFDGISVPFYYENGVKQALKLYKFNDKSFYAYILAQDMVESIQKDFEGVNFDFICFVPFDNFQKIERHYNPSELIAEEISKVLKIPVKNALVRLFVTGTQHDMAIGRRKGNVHGIYDVKETVDVKGKTVLLIDDIMTTGETLNNCALILKIRGAEKVYCAVAALTASKK